MTRRPANSDPIIFYTEEMLHFARRCKTDPQAAEEAAGLADDIRARRMPPKEIAARLRRGYEKYRHNEIVLATYMLIIADNLDPANARPRAGNKKPEPGQPRRRPAGLRENKEYRRLTPPPPAQQQFWWQKD